MSSERPLTGIGVLVTRPVQQASAFCERIAAAGGKPIRFPTIEILPQKPSEFLPNDTDILIVTSSNAVSHGKRIIEKFTTGEQCTTLIAVGRATATALQEAGFSIDHVPSVAGSEGVLSLSAMNDPAIRSVAILRGEEGRSLLQDSLEARGIGVTVIEVYQRALPATVTMPLVANWQKGHIDLVTVHSRAALLNLDKLLINGEKELLRNAQLVVPTTRMIKLCEELGISKTPVIADSAEDEDMFTAVLVAIRVQVGNQEQS